MQWEGREESQNVDDRRGLSPKGMAIGGGSILVLLIALFFGVDPQKVAQLIGQPGPGQVQKGEKGPVDPAEERMASFTRVVLRDTEIVWGKLFADMGARYQEPRLELFSGQTRSACGLADAAVGPFYCPADSKVYIDLSFYKDMEKQLKAGGEFARAYVIAHEVGHHVQRLLGYSTRVDQVRATGNEIETNRASVRLELQADYLAGVWAHHAQKRFNYLENGDLASAINAANQIGDDTLQKRGTGFVQPEKFTHGTSAQRKKYFDAGFRSGDPSRAKLDLFFTMRYEEL